jgi:hypothetical protein
MRASFQTRKSASRMIAGRHVICDPTPVPDPVKKVTSGKLQQMDGKAKRERESVCVGDLVVFSLAHSNHERRVCPLLATQALFAMHMP